jgi:hypothetical protein
MGEGRDKNAQTNGIKGELAGRWAHQIGSGQQEGVDHQINDRAGVKTT